MGLSPVFVNSNSSSREFAPNARSSATGWSFLFNLVATGRDRTEALTGQRTPKCSAPPKRHARKDEFQKR